MGVCDGAYGYVDAEQQRRIDEANTKAQIKAEHERLAAEHQRQKSAAEQQELAETALEAKIRRAEYIREHYLSPELVRQTKLSAAEQQELAEKKREQNDDA